MKILLMGNPNVGKSAMFSRLTGVHVIAANYPGTTVGYTKGRMRLGDEAVEVIDVPGTYSLEPTSKAEAVSAEMFEASGAFGGRPENDIVVNVVDATNLERNLYLTLELIERGANVIVALNLWDDAKHKGIALDVPQLEAFLKVPVVPTAGATGFGVKELVDRFGDACSPPVRKHTRGERWEDIGKIVERVQSLTHRHHTFLERLQDACIRPLTGIPIAMAALVLSFFVVRLIGESLIGYVLEPMFEALYKPVVMKLSGLLGGSGWLHTILVGNLFEGQLSFRESFGLLSTGLFVPIAMVFPYVLAFYFVLGVLEDSGYLPRLAILLDVLMHHLGLHGYAIIPMILGLGCNVPGILSTRILESRRERFIACTVMAIGVPCAALQAMIFGLVGRYGLGYVLSVYLTLFVAWLGMGWILNRSVKGFTPEIFIEVPPYRVPLWHVLLRKLWLRLNGFFKEAIPIVLAGVLIVNVLYLIKIFDVLATLTAPIVTNLLGLPEKAVVALVIGFLRKDVALGMLGSLEGLTGAQLAVGSVVLAMSFPCIATFAVLWRELGLRDMLKATLTMLVCAVFMGTLLNLVFTCCAALAS